MSTYMLCYKIRILASVLALAFSTVASADTPPPSTIEEKDVIAYLQETINWQRAVVDNDFVPESARAELLKDSLRQNSQKLVKSAFDFARAESAMLEDVQPVAATDAKAGNHKALFQRIAESKKHIEELREQLKTLESDETSEREKINGLLRVEQTRLELLNNFSAVFSADNTEEAGLTGSINKMYVS